MSDLTLWDHIEREGKLTRASGAKSSHLGVEIERMCRGKEDMSH